jgi:hypothetical protein
MRIKAIFMLSAMVAAGMMLAVPALSGETHRAQMEIMVDKYIAVCEAKSVMLDSRSENIRRSAIRSCLRGTLCRTSRAELIDELVAGNVEPKPYKVYHFLNSRFKEVVGTTELASR